MSLPADLGREHTDQLTPVPVAPAKATALSGPRHLIRRIGSRGKREARRLIERGVTPVIQPFDGRLKWWALMLRPTARRSSVRRSRTAFTTWSAVAS